MGIARSVCTCADRWPVSLHHHCDSPGLAVEIQTTVGAVPLRPRGDLADC